MDTVVNQAGNTKYEWNDAGFQYSVGAGLHLSSESWFLTMEAIYRQTHFSRGEDSGSDGIGPSFLFGWQW